MAWPASAKTVRTSETGSTPHAALALAAAVVVSGLSSLTLPSSAMGEVVFPFDANVIDLTTWNPNPLLRAIPDDGLDDSAAIQAALDAFPSGNTIFYFPNGQYDLSAQLTPAVDDGVRKRNIFQGQSRAGVVLKLGDNLGFTGAVIGYTANGAAQYFRNAVRDLTIDTGVGNPSATGLQFNASNQGTVKNVTIRSGDGLGAVGLQLAANEPGPMMIEDVEIIGFDTGINTGNPTASQTLENITLRDQRVVGWVNGTTQTVFARRINSIQSLPEVTSVQNTSEGRMVLLDSTLTNTATGVTVNAVRNQKSIYVAGVSIDGYPGAISNELGAFRGNHALSGAAIEEYWANGSSVNRRGGPYQLFDSPDTSLSLSVRETPDIPLPALSNWASPLAFGGNGDDSGDDTAAVQAAIDSGASVIYFPRGTWTVNGTVQLRGQVVRFIGTEARLEGSGKVVINDGNGEPVVIERLEGGLTYEHASSRELIMQNVLGPKYVPTAAAPGDVFLADAAIQPVTFRNQNVWARQLNIEGDIEGSSIEAKVLNDNARVWILGMKTEDDGTHIKTINGGMTELYGALHVAGFGIDPRFVTIDSSLFAVNVQGGPNAVRETRNGVTLDGTLNNVDVYTAFSHETLWDQRRQIILDNAGPRATLAGTWSTTTSFAGGWIEDNAAFSNDPNASATFTPVIPEKGLFDIAIRWFDDRSGQDHSGHAAAVNVFVTHAAGVSMFTVDMRSGGGKWVSLGQFALLPGEVSSVMIDVPGSGKAIADGVRFWQVGDLIDGDADRDGDVDFDDLGILLGNYDLPVAALTGGDSDGDGDVDFDDLGLLLGNYGFGLSPAALDEATALLESAGIVPEPGAMALVATPAALLGRRRRA